MNNLIFFLNLLDPQVFRSLVSGLNYLHEQLIGFSAHFFLFDQPVFGFMAEA